MQIIIFLFQRRDDYCEKMSKDMNIYVINKNQEKFVLNSYIFLFENKNKSYKNTIIKILRPKILTI